ncbi:MAG: D-glycero-beta-D-manno-heptose 1-phosphate adenylyltransferase [Candidatus Omnitrophica bacterium]|nr:D-glycero-beta-D-manno-heptose 1-phosphate adenylyltransferase [Candidatus Omnitrophota bacterium]
MRSEKIKSLRQLKKIVEELKKKGKKIVFTNGCFDILHAGHLYSLEKAKKLGDVLIVGINSDRSVRKLKGKKRPIVGEKDRSYLISGFSCVDYCVIFDQETRILLIETLNPDIIVKGADYKKKQIVGNDIVQEYGGKVVRMPLAPGRSTSSLIKKIHETD